MVPALTRSSSELWAECVMWSSLLFTSFTPLLHKPVSRLISVSVSHSQLFLSHRSVFLPQLFFSLLSFCAETVMSAPLGLHVIIWSTDDYNQSFWLKKRQIKGVFWRTPDFSVCYYWFITQVMFPCGLLIYMGLHYRVAGSNPIIERGLWVSLTRTLTIVFVFSILTFTFVLNKMYF